MRGLSPYHCLDLIACTSILMIKSLFSLPFYLIAYLTSYRALIQLNNHHFEIACPLLHIRTRLRSEASRQSSSCEDTLAVSSFVHPASLSYKTNATLRRVHLVTTNNLHTLANHQIPNIFRLPCCRTASECISVDVMEGRC